MKWWKPAPFTLGWQVGSSVGVFPRNRRLTNLTRLASGISSERSASCCAVLSATRVRARRFTSQSPQLHLFFPSCSRTDDLRIKGATSRPSGAPSPSSSAAPSSYTRPSGASRPATMARLRREETMESTVDKAAPAGGADDENGGCSFLYNSSSTSPPNKCSCCISSLPVPFFTHAFLLVEGRLLDESRGREGSQPQP